jgi:dTDP-4-amino-4,6-dideoxygalactose transaminase
MQEKNKYQYNSWPLGKLPKEFQRPELDLIKQKGYIWQDPRDAVDIFEKKVAEFAGSKYAITTDCCTHGLFLSLKYLQNIGEINNNTTITIPSRTYVSVPMQVLHAGCKLKFNDYEWFGLYQLEGTRIWDAAVRWTKNMYVGDDALQVVSFQLKKRIPIGKGGIILTNDEKAAKWLKLATYDGRDLTTPYTDPNHVSVLGYHMYMTPEDAARGILLMDQVAEYNEDSGGSYNYTDLSKIKLFEE